MTPAPYEIRGHTADVRLYASGKTREELFSHMIAGMGSIMQPALYEPRAEELAVRRELVVDGPDITVLLVDFLNEALYLSQMHREVYRFANFLALTDTHLEAELLGQEVDMFEADIKAATYHEAQVTQNKEGYFECTVIFDI